MDYLLILYASGLLLPDGFKELLGKNHLVAVCALSSLPAVWVLALLLRDRRRLQLVNLVARSNGLEVAQATQPSISYKWADLTILERRRFLAPYPVLATLEGVELGPSWVSDDTTAAQKLGRRVLRTHLRRQAQVHPIRNNESRFWLAWFAVAIVCVLYLAFRLAHPGPHPQLSSGILGRVWEAFSPGIAIFSLLLSLVILIAGLIENTRQRARRQYADLFAFLGSSPDPFPTKDLRESVEYAYPAKDGWVTPFEARASGMLCLTGAAIILGMGWWSQVGLWLGLVLVLPLVIGGYALLRRGAALRRVFPMRVLREGNTFLLRTPSGESITCKVQRPAHYRTDASRRFGAVAWDLKGDDGKQYLLDPRYLLAWESLNTAKLDAPLTSLGAPDHA